jgi:hypothetical protein
MSAFGDDPCDNIRFLGLDPQYFSVRNTVPLAENLTSTSTSTSTRSSTRDRSE